MTLATLLALWQRRDDRYGLSHRYLAPEEIATVRWWRLREIGALPEHDRPVARLTLREFTGFRP